MLLDNLIVEAWGVNMEKISLESLARRLHINNCKLCLIELPEKKLYRTHNMDNLIIEAWGANMEKISLLLAERFFCNNNNSNTLTY